MKKIFLPRSIVDQVIDHARTASPEECCGLIGTLDGTRGSSLYPAKNVAHDRHVTYEAAPSDLFSAQRSMRTRGERLLAIYHSHPASTDPTPSETDVRLAYYPDAVYLIIGLGAEAVIRAFEIESAVAGWTRAQCEAV